MPFGLRRVFWPNPAVRKLEIHKVLLRFHVLSWGKISRRMRSVIESAFPFYFHRNGRPGGEGYLPAPKCRRLGYLPALAGEGPRCVFILCAAAAPAPAVCIHITRKPPVNPVPQKIRAVRRRNPCFRTDFTISLAAVPFFRMLHKFTSPHCTGQSPAG